ncbi:hypothetical protein KBC79_02915 [Candidatus Woesebacteria bacterium]|nr:hypothetical protein [Candidatus Woesebacteria bacterium]
MAISKGRVYTKSNGGDIGESEATGLSITYLGQTLDGFDVSHFTFYRKNTRMSYDAVRINGEYHYILGSGHEVDERGNISKWDSGNQVRGTDALKRRAHSMIKNY